MRQYIGARYVPKFMGTYDATQVYEALSVVDNGLGTSYISKVPTPAGTPLTDTTYWTLYGASSGAIISLQNQIDDMKDGTVSGSLQQQINTNKTNIDSLKSRVNKGFWTLNEMKNKIVILIADSWGYNAPGGVNNWVDLITPYFNKVYAASGNGYSFNKSGASFITLLSGITIDPGDEIDAIIAIGGANTTNSGDVTAFINSCHSLYPTAEVVVGANGPHQPLSGHWKKQHIIENEGAKGGAIVIKGLWENVVLSPSSLWYTVDNYHMLDASEFTANILGYLTSQRFVYDYNIGASPVSVTALTSPLADYFKDLAYSYYSRVDGHCSISMRFSKGANFIAASDSITVTNGVTQSVARIDIASILPFYNNYNYDTDIAYRAYPIGSNAQYTAYIQLTQGIVSPYAEIVIRPNVSGTFTKAQFFTETEVINFGFNTNMFKFEFPVNNIKNSMLAFTNDQN